MRKKASVMQTVSWWCYFRLLAAVPPLTVMRPRRAPRDCRLCTTFVFTTPHTPLLLLNFSVPSRCDYYIFPENHTNSFKVKDYTLVFVCCSFAPHLLKRFRLFWNGNMSEPHKLSTLWLENDHSFCELVNNPIKLSCWSG